MIIGSRSLVAAVRPRRFGSLIGNAHLGIGVDPIHGQHNRGLVSFSDGRSFSAAADSWPAIQHRGVSLIVEEFRHRHA